MILNSQKNESFKPRTHSAYNRQNLDQQKTKTVPLLSNVEIETNCGNLTPLPAKNKSNMTHQRMQNYTGDGLST